MNTKMKTNKWFDFDFQWCGWSNTHENHSDAFDMFVRDFRSDIKRLLKYTDWEVLPFKGNWFNLSGFLYNKVENRYAYFSVDDVRHWGWTGRILLRSAEHDKDYHGERNTLPTLDDIVLALGRI